MNVTLEVQQQIRLLSDGPLYQQGLDLARRHARVSDAQLNGLLQFARGGIDLERFVRRQRERDWAQNKSTEHYRAYYDDLHQVLQQLQQDAAALVSASPAVRDREAQTAFVTGLLARELIQHFVAEAQYRRAVGADHPAGAAPTSQASEQRRR